MLAQKSPGQVAHDYIKRLQEFVKEDYYRWCGTSRIVGSNFIDFSYPRLSLEVGKKYARIVSETREGHQRSVFGFIEIMTGDLYKAATWKAVAKNFTRGNINDADGGLSRVKWTGIF